MAMRHLRTSSNFPRRGTTLVELMFTSVIFVVVMGAVLALFLSMLRQQKSTSARLAMTHEVSQLHRELRQLAANGANIAVTGGQLNNDVVIFRRLTDDEETPTFSELRYIDEDEDNSTIADNRIVLVPDRDADPIQEIPLVSMVSRLEDPDNPGNFLPVFTRSPGFGSPLVVQFRVGDRSAERLGRAERAANPVDREDDAVTGPGYQGIVFRAAYGPRNG